MAIWEEELEGEEGEELEVEVGRETGRGRWETHSWDLVYFFERARGGDGGLVVDGKGREGKGF